MGAARFGNLSAGTTPENAFSSAVSQALYEHGHGGYSGTIAEKRGFTLFTPPPGIAALDFVRWVRAAEDGVVPEEVPAEHRNAVLRAAEVSDSKWGPAAAVEIKGEELAALSKKYQFPAGARVFYFFGWASD